MQVCVRDNCVNTRRTLTPTQLVDLVNPKSPAHVFLQLVLYGEILDASKPRDQSLVIDVIERSKLPVLFLPSAFVPVADPVVPRGDVVAGHIVFYDKNQPLLHQAIGCSEPSCAALITFKDDAIKLHGRSLTPEDGVDARKIFAAFVTEHAAGVLPELDAADKDVTAGPGTAVEDWAPGTPVEITATNAQAWMDAVGNGVVGGILLAITQPSCSHCKKFAPEFSEAAQMGAALDVAFATFNMADNAFLAIFGDLPKGTPLLRFFFAEDEHVQSKDVTHARKAAEVFNAAEVLLYRLKHGEHIEL